MRTIGSKEDDT